MSYTAASHQGWSTSFTSRELSSHPSSYTSRNPNASNQIKSLSLRKKDVNKIYSDLPAVNKYFQVNTFNWVSSALPPPFKVWTFITFRHQWSGVPGTLPLPNFALLICKARLSLCKGDASRVRRRPRKQTLPPPPLPLTAEWQLFKCKLSLTNTTLRDTCFNHGNKGTASGRAGAPSLCDIQMTGRCNMQKQQHQRIGCARRERDGARRASYHRC